jgi:hypothetical protein
MLNLKYFATFILFFSFVLFNNLCFSQNKIQSDTTTTDDYYGNSSIRYEDYVYSPTIKTVQLHDESFEISQPIINLDLPEKLKLSFDELDADLKNYSYTFIHCNSNWQPSNLMPAEYIDGFQDNPITDYRFSFNTLQKYVHYNAVFPNNNSSITKSGNYILKVYQDGNPDNIILTKRFMVFQSKILIEGKVNPPSDVSVRNYNQEVDFTINYNNYTITNPYSDLNVVITKNNRWDNAKTNLKPLFAKGAELDYNLSQENVFPGGNEFRNVNIKSIRTPSDRIAKITTDSSVNNVFLIADEKRSFKTYQFNADINGDFLIQIQEGNNSEVEADYCYVHFFLSNTGLLTDGNLYIFGAYNGWRCNRDNMLHYNAKRSGYEATLYLKQGYYNYEYAFLNDSSAAADETLIEGTHYETENNYTIYVYHKQQGTYYEQLIGVKRINSTIPQ